MAKTFPPVSERLFAKTDMHGPMPAHRLDLGRCWIWEGGASQGTGSLLYGLIWCNGRKRPVHAVSWELHNGRAVPEGLVIDHLCRVTLCVRPNHLEVVTQRVNILRGVGVAAVNAVKQQCVNGHVFDAANTYIRPDGRVCRKCHRDSEARRRARRAGRTEC